MYRSCGKEISMRKTILVALALVFVAGLSASAQQPAQNAAAPAAQAPAAPAPQPPPLFFRESWKERPAGSPTGDIPLTPAFTANANLEMKLYGHAKEIVPSAEDERVASELNERLTFVWSGITEGNWAVTLRDRNNYVDLSGLGRIQWRTRQRGFHTLRPVIKLADGTMLVGDYTEPTSSFWRRSEFFLVDVPRWRVLDAEQVVESRDAVWRTNVDLSRIDEVGFTDLSRGGGHGQGGSSAVDWIEVYGKPVRRGTTQAARD
jgi:hypothetical protein